MHNAEQSIREETMRIVLFLNQVSQRKHEGILHSWKTALSNWVDDTGDNHTSIPSFHLECHCDLDKSQAHKLSFILIHQQFGVLVEVKTHYNLPLHKKSIPCLVAVHTNPYLAGVESAITECCLSNKDIAHVIAVLKHAIDEDVLPFI
ncbi:hypothetical protein ScPMuIL_014322 [Solemya velum]